jgi:hypothetical protein
MRHFRHYWYCNAAAVYGSLLGTFVEVEQMMIELLKQNFSGTEICTIDIL